MQRASIVSLNLRVRGLTFETREASKQTDLALMATRINVHYGKRVHNNITEGSPRFCAFFCPSLSIVGWPNNEIKRKDLGPRTIFNAKCRRASSLFLRRLERQHSRKRSIMEDETTTRQKMHFDGQSGFGEGLPARAFSGIRNEQKRGYTVIMRGMAYPFGERETKNRRAKTAKKNKQGEELWCTATHRERNGDRERAFEGAIVSGSDVVPGSGVVSGCDVAPGSDEGASCKTVEKKGVRKEAPKQRRPA